MQPTDITCGSVVLQPWAERDIEALVAGRNDPEVVRWTGSPFPYTREHAERYVREETPQWWSEGSAATWAVHDATTGAVLGAVALHGIKDGEGEIAYYTHPEGRGRGTTTEAVAAVCRWAFGVLELQRIGWAASVGNWASRAVAQKNGFTFEGTSRLAYNQRGTRVDDWLGSLLATDPMVDTRPLPRRVELSDGVVTLRRWRPEDAPDVTRACDDPLMARWLPLPTPYTAQDGVDYVDGFTARLWADGRAAELAVTDAVTGELLGACGLKLGGREQGFGEVGYWTAPWARGRGVAGRAAAVIAHWGLTGLGLSRVELLAEVGNEASQRAAESGGFVREGVLRSARRDRHGTPHDVVVFSRTAADAAAPPT
ncbi:MAG: family N-acetyltransferase [Frankiales bacterium]|nr:family N-acetyltransferase [Frankiales bacterium]